MKLDTQAKMDAWRLQCAKGRIRVCQEYGMDVAEADLAFVAEAEAAK